MDKDTIIVIFLILLLILILMRYTKEIKQELTHI